MWITYNYKYVQFELHLYILFNITDKEADFCEDCIERPKCTTKDKGLYVHLYQLQLGEITIPGDLRERFLNALLLQAKTEQAALAKNATIIEQETQVLVNLLQYVDGLIWGIWVPPGSIPPGVP